MMTQVAQKPTAEVEAPPAGRRREWLPVLSMLLVTLAGSLLPLVRTPGFYFWDDTEGAAVGGWQRIAEDVLSGQSPFLQLDMWRGGNFIAEAATGMWNPVMVALMVGTYPIDDVGMGITVAKVVMFLLTAGGVYLLARNYGATAWLAAAAGTTLALSGWVIFMDGSSWVNGTAITAFTPWAWWALRRAYLQDFRPWSVVLAAVLCYLVPSTGNPYGFLTLAVVFLAIGVEALVDRKPRALWWIVPIGAGIVLTLVIVYLPLVFTSAYGYRAGSGIENNESFAVSLSELAGMSTPTHRPFIRMFGDTKMGFPGTYLGWFILPLLPWLRWRGARLWSTLSGPIVFGAFFLLLALGPSQLGMFRWPARLVPFIYLAIVIVFAVLASRGLHRDNRAMRSWASAAIILFGVWIAWSDVPGAFKWHGLVTVAILGGIALLVFRTGLGGRGYATIATGLILFMGAQIMLTPSNQNVADYQMPSSRSELREQFADRADGLTVQIFHVTPLIAEHPAPERWDDLLAGNMPAVAGYPTTTGYSGIGFTAMDVGLCLTYNGGTCEAAWKALWAEPEGFDVPLADLLGARYVVVQNDFTNNYRTPKGWSETEETDVVTIYERDDELPFADGTVTYAGDGVEIASDVMSGKTGEQIEVTTTSGDTRVTFGRIAWPGYSATLDGQSIPVESGPSGVLTLELPENATGELRISFTPPGLYIGLGTAGLGILILAAVAVMGYRRHRAQSA